MAEEFRVLRPREYHSQLVSKGQRSDGRSLDEFRDIKLEVDAIRTADSSALVKLGNTSLVCGCTKQIMKINDKNEENEGIKINVELPPICSSPTSTRNQHTAQLLTSALRNLIDDSGSLDKKKFYNDELDIYWSINLEVICLNYDGCVLDAALLAILAALKSLKLSDQTQENNYVQLEAVPVCSSFAMIGEQIICDPNSEEETVASSTWSITVDSVSGRCCNINKIGGKAISEAELMKCTQLAKTRASTLKQVINSVNNELKMECT